MAAVTHGGWLASFLSRARPKAGVVRQSSKVYEFTERAYRKNGGVSPELKRVYKAYLDNQKLPSR